MSRDVTPCRHVMTSQRNITIWAGILTRRARRERGVNAHALPHNSDSASCNLACSKRAQFLQLSSLPSLHFVNKKNIIEKFKKFCKLKVYSFQSRIRSWFSTGYPPGEQYSLLGAPQVNITQTTKVSQFSDLLAAEEGLCPKLQSRYQRHWVLE